MWAAVYDTLNRDTPWQTYWLSRHDKTNEDVTIFNIHGQLYLKWENFNFRILTPEEEKEVILRARNMKKANQINVAQDAVQ